MRAKIIMGTKKPEPAFAEMPEPRLGNQMRIGTTRMPVRIITYTPLDAEQDIIVECF